MMEVVLARFGVAANYGPVLYHHMVLHVRIYGRTYGSGISKAYYSKTGELLASLWKSFSTTGPAGDL